MTFATNQEKLSSSVFRSIVRALKADEQLKEVLGEAIRPQPEWYLNGDPHVKGHVSFFFFNCVMLCGIHHPLLVCSRNESSYLLHLHQIGQLQGNIDVSFRIRGSKGLPLV